MQVDKSIIFEMQAQLCAVMANPKRLMIMDFLHRTNEACVGDIADELGLTVSAISQHLRLMRDNNVVVSRKEGQTVFCRLKHPKIMDGCAAVREVLIDDSCVYARYEDMVDQPRTLLEKAGVKIKEPKLCGKSTHCCGGPIEALFPTEAHRISTERVEQLKEAAAKDGAVTMCPICWVNLSKAAEGKIVIRDITEALGKAYV